MGLKNAIQQDVCIHGSKRFAKTKAQKTVEEETV